MTMFLKCEQLNRKNAQYFPSNNYGLNEFENLSQGHVTLESLYSCSFSFLGHCELRFFDRSLSKELFINIQTSAMKYLRLYTHSKLFLLLIIQILHCNSNNR